jgi:hypothetical protein
MTFRRWGLLYHSEVVNVSANKNYEQKRGKRTSLFITSKHDKVCSCSEKGAYLEPSSV